MRLTGAVETNETYISHEGPGLRCRRAPGEKGPAGIAVKAAPSGWLGAGAWGCSRTQSAASLPTLVSEHLEPGATVYSDARQVTEVWSGSGTGKGTVASGPLFSR